MKGIGGIITFQLTALKVIVAAKNRNGPIATVTMDFIPKFTKFIDR
ncbi:hypothetical protein [Borreliella lanei]